ncbi:MAG TPA: hypothetical protein VMV33_16000 [Rhodocyclaceae bacterium]|nr:hypothetical protein [Rhodocyclaceae bacterium]
MSESRGIGDARSGLRKSITANRPASDTEKSDHFCRILDGSEDSQSLSLNADWRCSAINGHPRG